MAKVAIVTDSTAYIPPEVVQKHNLTIVPQVVIWDNQTLEDGVDIQPTAFYGRLANSKTMPTTSQVSVLSMHNAFSKLLSEGYEVLGMFLSAKLSGTLQSAYQGRDDLPSGKDKVEIFDTESTAMGMGFQVLTVARAALDGASMADCLALAQKAKGTTGVFLVVDTLEFLHRGGRIGGAQRFLGAALNMKPVLELKGGRIEPVERVRTKAKAHDRLIGLVVEQCQGKSPIRLATLHANAAEDAKAILSKAEAQLKPVETVFSEVSPAVGTHTGPGTVGLCYMAGM
jgi:fatty acid kinase fatty acid binding subunit